MSFANREHYPPSQVVIILLTLWSRDNIHIQLRIKKKLVRKIIREAVCPHGGVRCTRFYNASFSSGFSMLSMHGTPTRFVIFSDGTKAGHWVDNLSFLQVKLVRNHTVHFPHDGFCHRQRITQRGIQCLKSTIQETHGHHLGFLNWISVLW